MTPQKLNDAVECYLKMRHLVEQQGRNLGPNLQVTLAQTEHWGATQVWQQIWWLFFFSGMTERTARPRADDARAGGWFNNFATFANANTQASHPWHVVKTCGPKGGIVFKPGGPEVERFCSKRGRYSKMPYRTGAKVIYRVNQLADFFMKMQVATTISGRSFINELAGGDAHAPDAIDKALINLTPVTGPITAVHCLSDLGFQCSKPDLWMSRIASWCGWTPNHSPDDIIYNRRDGWNALWSACLEIAIAANGKLPTPEHNPLRAFDWYVANYGMIYRPENCPCNSIVPKNQS
jgi:hypothetical protein